MEEAKALEIIHQVLKDRKQWGESAGIRVAGFELVNALLALEWRFGDCIPKEVLSKANRQHGAMNAQYEKAIKDSRRLRNERDYFKKLAGKANVKQSESDKRGATSRDSGNTEQSGIPESGDSGDISSQ